MTEGVKDRRRGEGEEGREECRRRGQGKERMVEFGKSMANP